MATITVRIQLADDKHETARDVLDALNEDLRGLATLGLIDDTNDEGWAYDAPTLDELVTGKGSHS